MGNLRDDGSHPTRWERISEGYYLCMIWDANGLRQQVWVGAMGEIRTSMMSWDKPEHVRMLNQVLAEAPAQIASLGWPVSAPTRRDRQASRRTAPKRSSGTPVFAKYQGVDVRTGEVYEPGTPIEYVEPLGWVVVGSASSTDDPPF